MPHLTYCFRTIVVIVEPYVPPAQFAVSRKTLAQFVYACTRIVNDPTANGLITTVCPPAPSVEIPFGVAGTAISVCRLVCPAPFTCAPT